MTPLKQPVDRTDYSLKTPSTPASTPSTLSIDSGILPVIDAKNKDTLFNLEESLGARKRGKRHKPKRYSQPLVRYTTYGTPETDAAYWDPQILDTSCAVVAQTNIYESITGVRISELDALIYSTQAGWYSVSGGTTLENTGKYLAALNIPTYSGWNGTFDRLKNALVRGDKVIAGVDSKEIWEPKRYLGQPVEQPGVGHAVWVTGIRQGTDGSIKVILNDSGISTGKGSVVDWKDFFNAWSDTNRFFAIADAPPFGTVV
jgi:hypothetical protein